MLCQTQSFVAARASDRAGFTLVEILMVVVILGIASAIIIPQMGTRDDLRVAAAGRMVASDLNFAQNRAIARQKKHYIVFSSQQYRICDSSALLTIDHPLLPQINNGKYVVNFGPAAASGLERVNLGAINFGGPSVIGFTDLGEPFSYDGVTETLLSAPATIIVESGAFSLTIQIEPFTGDVSVQ